MADQNQQTTPDDAPADTGQADYGSAGGQPGVGTTPADDDMADADMGLDDDTPDVAEVFGDDPQARG